MTHSIRLLFIVFVCYSSSCVVSCHVMLHPIVFIGPEPSCGKIASCRTIFQATLTLFLRIVTLFPGIAGVFQVFTGLVHKNLRLFQMKSPSRVVILPLRLMNSSRRVVISPHHLTIDPEKVVNFWSIPLKIHNQMCRELPTSAWTALCRTVLRNSIHP